MQEKKKKVQIIQVIEKRSDDDNGQIRGNMSLKKANDMTLMQRYIGLTKYQYRNIIYMNIIENIKICIKVAHKLEAKS